MSYQGDAAEQVVRLSLETGEIAVRLAGSGAKQVAVLLYAILKDQQKTKGKKKKKHQEGKYFCKSVGNQGKEQIPGKQGCGQHAAGEQGDDGKGREGHPDLFHTVGQSGSKSVHGKDRHQ